MKLLMILYQHWKLFATGLLQIKWLKELFTDLYADENILYFNKDSCNFVSNCNEMGILNTDLNNINLDNNFIKIILILLFLPHFWQDILDLKTQRTSKRVKWRINANRVASWKMVGLVRARRWEKEIDPMLKSYKSVCW